MKKFDYFYKEGASLRFSRSCSNISFEVNQGDRIALYGKNGCGKSTILKFINGNDKIKLTGNFEKASNLKKIFLILAEGKKKKVLIAKSLCEQAHLYLWDEPLNFIDILSRIQIENLILKFKSTILFVEHDKIFSEKIATKILKISAEKNVIK